MADEAAPNGTDAPQDEESDVSAEAEPTADQVEAEAEEAPVDESGVEEIIAPKEADETQESDGKSQDADESKDAAETDDTTEPIDAAEPNDAAELENMDIDEADALAAVEEAPDLLVNIILHGKSLADKKDPVVENSPV